MQTYRIKVTRVIEVIVREINESYACDTARELAWHYPGSDVHKRGVVESDKCQTDVIDVLRMEGQ